VQEKRKVRFGGGEQEREEIRQTRQTHAGAQDSATKEKDVHGGWIPRVKLFFFQKWVGSGLCIEAMHMTSIFYLFSKNW
jgi:hypothetical protein